MAVVAARRGTAQHVHLHPLQWWTASVALLALCSSYVRASYKCSGEGCCDARCEGAQHCRSTDTGTKVPKWWPHDSCAAKLLEGYNASIPCHEALQPFEPCGEPDSHACGYGLACVAESITYAQCVPICASAFHDELLHRESVAAGCKREWQHGDVNHDKAGEFVPVGNVVDVGEGIAVPECMRDMNLAATTSAGLKTRTQQATSQQGAEKSKSTAFPDEEARSALAQQVVGLSLLFMEVHVTTAYLRSFS